MAGVERHTLFPKAIIHQKFGANAIYRIEEVHVSSKSSCSGLVTPQKGPCLYRCYLQLPEFSVVSNVFEKKEDSEQSAAELALEKLGFQTCDVGDDDDISVDKAWDDIAKRIKYIFSDEFLSANHPLGSHLRATLHRDGERCGSLPVSVIATFDARINSRCKVINPFKAKPIYIRTFTPLVESDPILAMSYVMKAATKLSDYVVITPHIASIRRKNPYPPAITKALDTRGKSIRLEAVYIQCKSGEEEVVVDPITLDIPSGRYYLDTIAERLGIRDSSQLMISRIFGKTCSGYECRVYSAISKLSPSDKSSKAYGKRPVDESSHFKNSWNAKASLACGQDVHGDAIVASVGYPWRSHDLEHDDVTLKSFYRIFYSISPNGIYKTSRNALNAAHLPVLFTSKAYWRGLLPQEILCLFCRQQQLAEPVFTVSSAPVKPLYTILKSYQKLKDSESDDHDRDNQSLSMETEEIQGSRNGYRCEVKILSKSHDLVLDCSSRNFYKKENYAIQNASLKALSWFCGFFDDMDADPLHPEYDDEVVEGLFEQKICMIEINTSSKRPNVIRNRGSTKSRTTSSRLRGRKHVRSIPKGSLVTIRYSVFLTVDADFSRSGESLKEHIESSEEIEFEVGNGSMNENLELVVTQMTVGQYACFATDSPAQGLVLAAAADTVRTRSLFSELVAGFQYRVHLLGVKGPREKPMDESFFKPPLPKQRVEYAVKHIKESSASTLVDFGCGSGSSLESLLDYPTSLQTIASVDISQKCLARAAKMLHSKMNMGSCNLKSVILYDGSILEFDSRLRDIDIGICFEVIEHMEEEQACQFGETVLSLFRPKLLIVSTPNYDYTMRYHKPASHCSKDKSTPQKPKFRNHKLKFEWTRDQFNQWASKLAKRHNYIVEFSGVGGLGKFDPGFASQIAVFKQQPLSEVNLVEKVDERSLQPYKVIWEWSRANGEKKD
ncbi:unnamed protein product [Cochlearia groenlandica]